MNTLASVRALGLGCRVSKPTPSIDAPDAVAVLLCMQCEEGLEVTPHTTTRTMREFALEHAHPLPAGNWCEWDGGFES